MTQTLRRLAPSVCVFVVFASWLGQSHADSGFEGEASTSHIDIESLRQRFGDHCFGCHGDGGEEGGLSFEKLAEGGYGEETISRWESIWKNVRAETMPPPDEEQPELADRQKWVDWIQRDIFRLDVNKVDPGKVVLRRLNRSEYTETIRQLTDIDANASENFPADDTGYGFDTIGEVLHISPVLLEKYLASADKIVTEAIPISGPTPPRQKVWGDHFHLDAIDGPRNEGLKFVDAHDLHIQETIKNPGAYDVEVNWELDGAWTNTDQAANVKLRWHRLGDDQKEEIVELDSAEASFIKQTEGTLSGKVSINDKPLHLSVSFEPTSIDTKSKQLDNSNPAPYTFRLTHTEFVGPTDGKFVEYRSGTKILFNGPPPQDAGEDVLDEMTAQVLDRFATKAFRRPIDAPTLARLTQIAKEARSQPGMRYENGVATALKLILASPRFLFRAEQPLGADQLASIPVEFPTSPLGDPIDDYSLASRVSYFLWGGPPDEQLMRVAGEGKLREQLDEQISRMIGEEWRTRVGVGNFVGQWLRTRDVHSVPIDVRRVLAFRGSDSDFPWQVREAMKQETETMFRYLLEENRPIAELLNADYTFLNKHLAKFYGIEGVKGDEMRKVSLPADSHRRGILTHGSVLLVTSNPTRTSPVKRGLFILQNLLGTPSPPAPPNVPALEESKKGDMAQASLRQILEQHRRDPMCASCHNRMDPLGLALENYNAIGQYRDQELGMPEHRGRPAEPDKPIDPTGVLMTGEKFSSVVELADILANQRKDDFYRCMTEKMLVFALGRGLTYSDATTVDQIIAELKADDGRMQTLIKAIVRSVPFTHQPKTESIARLP